MPIDPQAQVVLDLLAQLDVKPFDQLSVAEARALLDGFKAMAPPGAEVAKVEDTDADGVPVRVYTPAGEGPFPVLVWMHGGGWVLGDVEGADNTARELCNAVGATVVSVDYRLAPEHPFPAPLDDCLTATRWAAALGTPLAVGGDSAGANLAAAVSILARDQGRPAIAFQLLVYPVTDNGADTASYRENADGYFLTAGGMKWFWDHYAAGDDPRASVARTEDLTGLPPALVITAEYDPLRDEGEAYADAMRAAGVQATVTRYPGQIHGFFGMPHAIDAAKRAVEEAADALRKVLHD